MQCENTVRVEAGKSNVILYILMRSQCWEREEKEAKVRGAEPGNQLRFIS